MARNLLLALGLLIGLGAVLAYGAVNAADPVFCGKYVSDAVKAVSAANHLKCGFKGPRWGKEKGGTHGLVPDRAAEYRAVGDRCARRAA